MMGEGSQRSVDVVVVCALAEEARAFLEVVEQQCQVAWTVTQTRQGDEVRMTTIRNTVDEELVLQVSWLVRYGPQEMVLHLSRIVEEAQPRLVVMTGICAGDRRQVQLGDLIVAERVFQTDTGKYTKDAQGQTVHQYDTQTYQLPEGVLRFVQLFVGWKPLMQAMKRPPSRRQQRDWLLMQVLKMSERSLDTLSEKMLKRSAPDWRTLLPDLQRSPDPLLTAALTLRDPEQIRRMQYGVDIFPWKDRKEAACHIKPLASSRAMRSDEPFAEVQVPVRSAVALDMEGAAFGRVMAHHPLIPWLVVKGVSDHADVEKDDTYHGYAARASARYALSVMQAYVTTERMPRVAKKQEQEKRIWQMPFARNPSFTGREDVLDRLTSALKDGQKAAIGQPQAISGLGGIGKTQLVTEYAYRHRDVYQHVFWVQADTTESLVAGYGKIAQELALPEQDAEDQEIMVGAVKRWLMTEQGNWLLLEESMPEKRIVVGIRGSEND